MSVEVPGKAWNICAYRSFCSMLYQIPYCNVLGTFLHKTGLKVPPLCWETFENIREPTILANGSSFVISEVRMIYDSISFCREVGLGIFIA